MPGNDQHAAGLAACPCCGLVQELPPRVPGRAALCVRCATVLPGPGGGRNRVSLCLALAGLAVYPPAMLLPMVELRQLGFRREDSLLSGIWTLLGHGSPFLGLLLLCCSVILPLVKLLALYWLSLPPGVAMRERGRAMTWRILDVLGRWGMLDVVLVALLAAMVRLGGVVTISPGPGVYLFTVLVLCSLGAGLAFDSRGMWSPQDGTLVAFPSREGGQA